MFALARRAVGRAASSGKALGAARVVTSSAAPEAAAAAAAAPAAKPANVQEFRIYRWDPDTGGKPRYQTYKVRATPRDPTLAGLARRGRAYRVRRGVAEAPQRPGRGGPSSPALACPPPLTKFNNAIALSFSLRGGRRSSRFSRRPPPSDPSPLASFDRFLKKNQVDTNACGPMMLDVLFKIKDGRTTRCRSAGAAGRASAGRAP